MKNAQIKKEITLPQTALLAHTHATQKMLTKCSERAMKNCITCASLLPHLAQKENLTELFQMQAAAINRFQEQYQEGLEGFTSLMHDMAAIKNANTMTKFVSQQFNLVGQFGQLMNAQTTNLLGLQENIEVDFGYWASQKAHG